MDRVKLIERIISGEGHQAELREEVASLDDAGLDEYYGVAQWLPRLMEIESAFFPPSPERLQQLIESHAFGADERRQLFQFFDDLVFRKGKTGRAINSAILAAVALRIIRLLARLEEIIVANDPSYRPAKTDRRELFLLIHEFRRGRLGQNGMHRLAQVLEWHPGKSGRPVAVAFGHWVKRSGLSKEVGYTHLVVHALRTMKDCDDSAPEPIRLDRQWEGNSRNPVVPLDIQLERYIRWFRNKVTKVIKDTLVPDRHKEHLRQLEARTSDEGEQVPSADDQEQYKRYRNEERRCSSGESKSDGETSFENEEHAAEGQSFGNEEHVWSSANILDGDNKGSKLQPINRVEIDARFRRARQAGIKLSRLQNDVWMLMPDRSLQHWSDIARQLGTTRKTLMVEMNRLKKKVERLPATRPAEPAKPSAPRLVKKTA